MSDYTTMERQAAEIADLRRQLEQASSQLDAMIRLQEENAGILDRYKTDATVILEAAKLAVSAFRKAQDTEAALAELRRQLSEAHRSSEALLVERNKAQQDLAKAWALGSLSKLKARKLKARVVELESLAGELIAAIRSFGDDFYSIQILYGMDTFKRLDDALPGFGCWISDDSRSSDTLA